MKAQQASRCDVQLICNISSTCRDSKIRRYIPLRENLCFWPLRWTGIHKLKALSSGKLTRFTNQFSQWAFDICIHNLPLNVMVLHVPRIKASSQKILLSLISFSLLKAAFYNPLCLHKATNLHNLNRTIFLQSVVDWLTGIDFTKWLKVSQSFFLFIYFAQVCQNSSTQRRHISRQIVTLTCVPWWRRKRSCFYYACGKFVPSCVLGVIGASFPLFFS